MTPSGSTSSSNERRAARHREVTEEEWNKIYASDDESLDDGDESFEDEVATLCPCIHLYCVTYLLFAIIDCSVETRW
jgi:hypothetical protein